MDGVVALLRYAGFTNVEIAGFIILGLSVLLALLCSVLHGRFFKYKINGVEVIKDRKLGKEYIAFKGRELN